MKGKITLKTINTELGPARISEVHNRLALKKYICPLCDLDIPIGEKHHLVIPVDFVNYRRHIHTKCLKLAIGDEHFLTQTIRLHPNADDLSRFI